MVTINERKSKGIFNMVTVSKYDVISRKDFIEKCLDKDGGATYRVSGIEVMDLQGDMVGLNEFLTNCVEDGCYLQGLSYKFVAVSELYGTVTIQVDVENVEEYLKNNHIE
jgi:hypothetical protein